MTLALKIMDERREARIEGIKEARIETCRKALRMNLPLEDIMELTGLTSAEIQAIAAAQ